MSSGTAAAASKERAGARASESAKSPQGKGRKEEETLRAPNETFLAGGPRSAAPLSVDITCTGCNNIHSGIQRIALASSHIND